MKLMAFITPFFTGVLLTLAIVAFTKTINTEDGYIIEHEKEIGTEEPGSHNGGGLTTAYSFFTKAADLKLIFRKRVLRPGSSIGYHLQKEDEIYYIAEGHGELTMNGKKIAVRAGDAILTRGGNSHGLKPVNNDSLTVIINYNK
jgi:mannose-6-phosphate isomerase-like protein (cupin superfamily)